MQEQIIKILCHHKERKFLFIHNYKKSNKRTNSKTEYDILEKEPYRRKEEFKPIY